MEHTDTATVPFAVPQSAVERRQAEAVVAGTIVAPDAVGIIDITGPGVVTCLQGLLTCDIEKAGDGSFLYGALLTNKGMIVCDMWAARHGGRAWLTVPLQGRDRLLEAFGHYLPPRLAHPTDHTDELAVLRIAGPHALSAAAHAGIGVPDSGISRSTVVGGVACIVSRPPDPAPFSLQVQLERDSAAAVLDALAGTGAVVCDTPTLDLARMLAGWPRLGAEIGDMTLPQEVRFDEHNGVSYTKGCYTGQETVARVHFRGHVNKHLAGLLWDGTPDPSEPSIRQDDAVVGQVTSMAWLSPFEQHIGLGVVRRRVDSSRLLMAASAPAVVVGLPFQLEP